MFPMYTIGGSGVGDGGVVLLHFLFGVVDGGGGSHTAILMWLPFGAFFSTATPKVDNPS